MSALAFALVAVVLTGPIPTLLVRADWPLRAPRAALVLWQAIAIAAVLSAFSAGIAIAARLLTPGSRPAVAILGDDAGLGRPLWMLYAGVFVLTLLVGTRLSIAVTQVAIATRQRRARHRTVIDLVGITPSMEMEHAHRLRILQVAQPLAYCLPGMRSRLVLSAGALNTLTDLEANAVLSHESAHLRARHDLVLEAFTALHTAFPRVVRSANALDAVRLLVELLADDAAVRSAGAAPLARALVACADARTPTGALAAGGASTVLRVQRLAGPGNSRLIATATYTAAAAVLTVPTIALAVPWLIELRRLFVG